ncbi:MAG: hypothetical protein KF687_16350 [Cyclobacteriaceae bacterium]|nr:hypothetical protein [Cyclobacteriaceae bacterium]
MEKTNITGVARLSEEAILDHVRTIRNNLIKDFLDERFLINHFSEVYHLKELTRVKVEFIKRDLKEMLIHPVDTVHYKEVMNQIRQSNSLEATEQHERLFYEDVTRLFKQYM